MPPTLNRRLRKFAEPFLSATRIYRWSRRTSPYALTDLPRKTPAQIRTDLRSWEARYGTYDFSYFGYGADIVGRPIDTYMPYEIFKQYRNASNRTLSHNDDFTYECLLEDKSVFERYTRAGGHPTPEICAVLTPTGFVLPGETRVRSTTTFPDVFAEFSGILKPAVGVRGTSVFRIETRAGEVYIEGDRTEFAAFASTLQTRYVLQRRIRQHAALAALNESSVNTLRLVTVREAGGARPLSTVLKMGRRGGTVDNVIRGGIAVLVDMEQGVLRGRGMSSPGTPSVDVHPDSGILLEGYALPHFDACVQAACALHEDLYGFHSVGWDVAVTDEGPVIIEGNSNWGGTFHFTLNRSFMAQYLDALGALPPQPYRHRHARLVD